MTKNGGPSNPRLYRFVLLLCVTLVAASILLRDSGHGLRRSVPAPLAKAPTNAELAHRLINRFAVPPQGGRIVHEIVSFEGPVLRSLRRDTSPEVLTLERWYDYGRPPRLRVEVRRGEQLLYAAAADGQGYIQIDASENGAPGTGIRSAGRLRVTARLTPQDAARLVPLLRQPYANAALLAAFPTLPPPVAELVVHAEANPAYADGNVLSPFFSLPPPLLSALRAVKNAPASIQFLGTTTALGRPSWRVAVYAAQRSYVLTVDQQTFAIIELQEIRAGGQHASLSPWRTRVLEVLPSVPDETFQLGPPAWGYFHRGRLPPLWYWQADPGATAAPTDQAPPFTLLLPDPLVLSDSLPMLAWDAPPQMSVGWYAVTLLWSEYGLLTIVQLPRRGGKLPVRWPDEEGGRRFLLLPTADKREASSSLYTIVDAKPLSADEPTTRLYIGLFLPLATPEERERTFRQVIRTLKPATDEDLRNYWVFTRRS